MSSYHCITAHALVDMLREGHLFLFTEAVLGSTSALSVDREMKKVG